MVLSIPPYALLVTIDVISLYANIPHDKTLNSVKFYVDKRGSTECPPVETMTKVIDHVLKTNVIKFEGNYNREMKSTAMGTLIAPAAANLFMGLLETIIADSYPTTIQREF